MIQLTEYQMTLCRLFARESAKTQQEIEFGNPDTAPRSVDEIARDNLTGKMAEVAIATMARHEFGYLIPVNYEVYPRGQYDNEDMNINGWSIDVKATRRGNWLLIEKNKIDFRRKENRLPDVVMLCRVDGDAVELVGCTSVEKLTDPDNADVMRLRAGGYLPGTSCRLQADNYAVRREALSDIRAAVRYMVGCRNVTADNFKAIAEAIIKRLRKPG